MPSPPRQGNRRPDFASVAPREVLARLRRGVAKPQVKLLIGVSDPYSPPPGSALRRLQPRRRLGAAAAGHRHRPEPAPAVTGAAPPVAGLLNLGTPWCRASGGVGAGIARRIGEAGLQDRALPEGTAMYLDGPIAAGPVAAKGADAR
jgi:hypothetical protein